MASGVDSRVKRRAAGMFEGAALEAPSCEEEGLNRRRRTLLASGFLCAFPHFHRSYTGLLFRKKKFQELIRLRATVSSQLNLGSATVSSRRWVACCYRFVSRKGLIPHAIEEKGVRDQWNAKPD